MRGVYGASTLGARRRRVFDIHAYGHRLLLEPLGRVALMDVRPARQVGRSQWTGPGEPSVQVKPVSQVHRQEIESAQSRLEQPTDKLLRPVRDVLGLLRVLDHLSSPS